MTVPRLSSAALLLLASGVSGCLQVYGTNPTPDESDGDAVASSASSGGNASSGVTSGSGGAGGAGAGGMGGAGGSVGEGGAGGSGGGMPPPPFCDPTDERLLACFRFDGNTNDGSGKSHDVTATNVTLSGGAADFGASGQITIADAPHWDAPEYTVELWYYQRNHGDPRMGLFDSDGRFGLFVYGQGGLTCLGGNAAPSTTNMPLNAWIHAACVFGGGTLRLYVNGELAAEASAVPPVPNDLLNTLGSNAPSGQSLDGLIDDVRVWNVARTASEICAAAGKSGC